MIRLAKMKPGGLYQVSYNNATLRVVFVEKTRFRQIGDEINDQFLKSDIFLYVESVVAAEMFAANANLKWAYEPDEKIHHFLLREKSYWVTSKSLKKMEHWYFPGNTEEGS